MSQTLRPRGHHQVAPRRHRVEPTFTPWRLLFLLLTFAIPLAGMLLGIHAAPNGGQLFHSTVMPGELPVVRYQPAAAHTAFATDAPAGLDPIMTAVHRVCLDDIAAAIAEVS